MSVLQVRLSGTMIAGPAQVSECWEFPSGTTTIPLALFPACKQFVVATGDQFVNLNSPSSFATLAGVGTTVTRGHTLLVRTQTSISFRLTQQDPSLTPTVKVIPGVDGLLLLEFGVGFELSLLEAEGVGNVEYSVWGNS